MTTKDQKNKNSRIEKRSKIISSVKGPVAFMRPEDIQYLRGDAAKLKMTFGWIPEYTFEKLMDEMIEHWVNIYK